MPLAEKGVRGKGRQPLSPPQHAEATRSAAHVSADDVHAQGTIELMMVSNCADRNVANILLVLDLVALLGHRSPLPPGCKSSVH